MKPKSWKTRVTLSVNGGDVRIYIDGYIALSYRQDLFVGAYSYRDGVNDYGIDLYLKERVIIETMWEDRNCWLRVLELLDELR